MKAKSTEKKKPNLRWLKRIGVVLAVLLLAPTILFTIGWFSRDLLIDQLQDWYKNNNNGSLEIGEVDARFLSGFPNVGFIINDIKQTSFDTILDKNSSIFIEEARVSIAAKDLLTGNLKFKKISIDHSEIYSEVKTEKSEAAYLRLKEQLQEKNSSDFKLPDWISKKTDFRLRDVIFVVKAPMLNKYFNLEVHEINGSIRSDQKTSTGSIEFRILANDLGFNTKKGTFIHGAIVQGKTQFVLDIQKGNLDVAAFPIEIGKEVFTTKANFNFNDVSSYNFSLENPKTDFQELKRLLADSLTAKLSIYKIANPIQTGITIKGNFQHGDVPYIDGNFSTENNQVWLADSIQLDAIDFKGYLTNTLGSNKGEIKSPGRRDIKVYFEEFSANMDNIDLEGSNSYYQSSKEARNFIDANLKVSGSNEKLAKVLNNENFNFIGGYFNLETRIYGDIPSTSEVFDATSGSFEMRNTRVVLQQNNVQLPVEVLNLELDKKNSTLRRLVINLPDDENLIFSGNIQNVSSLLSSNPDTPASAMVMLQSDTLNINSLISTATEFIPESEKSSNDLETLHETLEAIYKKFQPRFKLNLSRASYNEMTFTDLIADVQLSNSETVLLRDLHFNYQEALTELSGTLRIPKSTSNGYEPIFIDLSTNSSGPIAVFQELFNIQLLNIENGTYNFAGNVTGDIYKFEELLNNTNGDLKLLNAQLYYPKADIDLELDSLKVSIHDANIKLEQFVVELDDHRPFSLSARIENFPGFLVDEIESNGRIFVALDAHFVDMDNWMETINSIDFEAKDKSLKTRDLSAIFSDIYQFDPEFKLTIDSLQYQQIVSKDIATKVYFENDSILKLDDLNIRFRNSEAVINGVLNAKNQLGMEDGQKNPFNFEFSAEASGRSEDLNELLRTVNFVLRSGDFQFNGSYQGEAQDLDIMNTNAEGVLILRNTMVDVEAADIQIPVDSLHLTIKNNLASLERLDVNLPGKSSIDITGKIDNFSNFINNDQAIDSHNSSFNIKSPYLDSKDIERFIGTDTTKVSSQDSDIKIKNLKQIISDINYTYFPSASIEIDSLIHNQLKVSNFTSRIGFNDSGAIQINDTKLNFYEGAVGFDIEAGVTSSENLPVKIDMDITNIDLQKLVKDLDYFGDKELRNAEKITGDLDLNFKISGILNSDGQLDMNSVNGILQMDLKDLSLYNYNLITENVKLLKEERFEKLQFQPIQQTFNIVNGEISVPRTQIQSSAIQFFVEGSLKIGEFYNLWISVPWNNILKSRDGLKLPEKIAFEKSGAKFYLQIVQDKESEKPAKRELKMKFKLSNRKLEKKNKE